MYLEEDRFACAHEERQRRRRRLLATIRGWLRVERWPRLELAAVVFICVAGMAGASFCMKRCGIEFCSLRWACATLAAWPLFLALLRWRAAAEFRRLRITDHAACIRRDELAEFALAVPVKSDFRRQMEEEFNRSASRELGRVIGSGGLPALLLLAAVTAGIWLLIDLVRCGPTLLAEAVIDGFLRYAHPVVAAHVHTESWLQRAAGFTAPHFIGLALAAWIAGLFFPFFVALPW